MVLSTTPFPAHALCGDRLRVSLLAAPSSRDLVPWDLNASDPCPQGVLVPEQPPPPPNITSNIRFPFQLNHVPALEAGFKIATYVIAMIMAIVGNVIVIMIVLINRRMRTTTNYYILNLAISDLMVGCFCMWLHLGINLSNNWIFGRVACHLNPVLQVLAVQASVLFLTVIAGDRFFVIVYPIRARFTRRYAALVVAVTWVIAFIMALPNAFVRQYRELIWKDYHQKWCTESWPRYISGSYVDPKNNQTRCTTDIPGRRTYYSVQILVMFFLPILIMVCAYIIIIHTLWKRNVPGVPTDKVLLMQRRAKQKVVRMLVVVFFVFVVCWTPFQGLLLYDAYSTWQQSRAINPDLFYAATYVAYANSSINPLLYAGLNENFRNGFIEAFSCRLIKKRVQVGPAIVSTVAGNAVASSSDPAGENQHHSTKNRMAASNYMAKTKWRIANYSSERPNDPIPEAEKTTSTAVQHK